MVRLMTVGEGGSRRVEGGEASVSRIHGVVGHEAELQGVHVSSTRMMSPGDLVGVGAQLWSHRLVWLGVMRECLVDKTGSNG
jgi:hypothetical protein